MPGNISNLCCAAKKRITLLQEFCHISVGTLVHIRESTCCTLKGRNMRHLQVFDKGTEQHIARLGY